MKLRGTLALLALVAGCNCGETLGSGTQDGGDGGEPDSGLNPPGPDGGGPDAGPVDGGPDDAGTLDAGTIDGGRTSYPIKHVIIVVKENHTFDNYFGTFPGAEGTTTYTLSDGGVRQCGHAPDHTLRDMSHAHASALTDWNHGQMNGWDLEPTTSTLGDNLAYAQYHEADIPNYWAYARTFTLADHFYAQMLGPSFPGHLEVLAAQAGWALGNPGVSVTHPYWGCDQDPRIRVPIEDQLSCTTKNVFPCFDIPSVPDLLPVGTTWKFYGSNFYLFPEIWSMFNAVRSVRYGPGWSNVVNVTQFEKDVELHQLPDVTWLVDQDLASEHPQVGGVCVGENWTVQKLNKLMASEYWKDSAILFTMDDFGGWYDHVPPPLQYGCDPTKPYGLGFRLPLIIISPYAKPHFIFKEVAAQASIPRFIEKIFGATKTLSELDPAAQDGQSNDLLNAFDFDQTPLPPLTLPKRKCL